MTEKRKVMYCKYCGVDFLAEDSLQQHENYCKCYFCQYFDLYAPGFCTTDDCVKDKEKESRE